MTTVYDSWVGQKVAKTSDKPFKSKEKINTVKAVVVSDLNPEQLGLLWFTFEEDDSIVETRQYELVQKHEIAN